MLKKAALIIGASMMLVSCGDKYSGRLNMVLDLLVRTTKGTKLIQTGTYDFELKLTGKSSADLQIKGMDGVEHKVKFKSSDTTVLPTDGNGPIFVSGIENSQNFDLVGQMTTEHRNDDEIRRDYEQCTFEEPVRHCQRDRHGRWVCYTRWETRWGRQEVEYSLRHTTETVSVDMTLINDGRVAGAMESVRNYATRVYRFIGRCW